MENNKDTESASGSQKSSNRAPPVPLPRTVFNYNKFSTDSSQDLEENYKEDRQPGENESSKKTYYKIKKLFPRPKPRTKKPSMKPEIPRKPDGASLRQRQMSHNGEEKGERLHKEHPPLYTQQRSEPGLSGGDHFPNQNQSQKKNRNPKRSSGNLRIIGRGISLEGEGAIGYTPPSHPGQGSRPRSNRSASRNGRPVPKNVHKLRTFDQLLEVSQKADEANAAAVSHISRSEFEKVRH